MARVRRPGAFYFSKFRKTGQIKKVNSASWPKFDADSESPHFHGLNISRRMAIHSILSYQLVSIELLNIEQWISRTNFFCTSSYEFEKKTRTDGSIELFSFRFFSVQSNTIKISTPHGRQFSAAAALPLRSRPNTVARNNRLTGTLCRNGLKRPEKADALKEIYHRSSLVQGRSFRNMTLQNLVHGEVI